MDPIYIANDLSVHLDALTDNDGVAVTNATVTARVLDDNEAEVAGITWPVALSHTGNGNYEAIIDAAMQLATHQLYYLDITAATPTGLDANWRIERVGARRTR